MKKTKWKQTFSEKNKTPEKKHSPEMKKLPEKNNLPEYRKTPEKRKSSQERKSPGNIRKRERSGMLHIAELLIIAGVIAIAFFTPQVLFYIQDRILWGRQELSHREDMDVEALSSNYEKSLYQRMQNYAEGLADGDTYYVTAKTLTINEELEEYLYSDKGLYQTIMDYIISYGFMPVVFWEGDCTVEQWKQYVIYSNNFTKGVNFILWYIELSSVDGIKLKLLADAESGTLYGLKMENCQWIELVDDVLDDYVFLSDEELLGLWSLCGLYYEVFTSESDMLDFIQERLSAGTEKEQAEAAEKDIMEGVQFPPWSWDTEIAGEAESDGLGIGIHVNYSIAESAAINYILGRIQIREENLERIIGFQMPYGKFSLDIIMKSRNKRDGVPDDIYNGYYMFPDTVIGVRQIYEMIPEFL